MKHYLNKNNKYKKAIIEKNKNNTKYCFYKIIDLLIEEMPNESQDQATDTAINHFWESIHPEADQYNILFNFKVDSYYIIKVTFPDNTKEYVKSDAYPGKRIYISKESALSEIKRMQSFYPDKTILKIEKMDNE